MSGRLDSLEEVLIRFHETVEVITPEVIATWTSEYPQFAEEIRAEALELLDLKFRARGSSSQPTPRDYTAMVRAAAHRAAERDQDAAVPSLREALEQHHTDVRTFAGALGIARSVVADISTGQIIPTTIPVRFKRAGAERLGCTLEWFEAVIESSRPRLMATAFKASDVPTTGRARTWEEAIRSSSMPDDRKAFWLAEEA